MERIIIMELDITNVATWTILGIGNTEMELNNIHQEYKKNIVAITEMKKKFTGTIEFHDYVMLIHWCRLKEINMLQCGPLSRQKIARPNKRIWPSERNKRGNKTVANAYASEEVKYLQTKILYKKYYIIIHTTNR